MDENKTIQRKPSKAKKAWNIISWVFIGCLAVFDVFLMVMRVKMPSSSSGLSLFGHQTRIVLTNSMEGDDEFYKSHPEYEIQKIPMHSAVRIEETPKDLEKQRTFFHALKEGDVITFYWSVSAQASVYTSDGDVITITHRIQSVTGSGDNLSYVCQGDNRVNASGDIVTISTQTVPAMMVVGKVTSVSVPYGWFLVNIVQNRYVMAALIIVPCLAVVVYESYTIVRLVKQDKKEQAMAAASKEAETKAKDEELEELRKRIASLEQENSDPKTNQPSSKGNHQS